MVCGLWFVVCVVCVVCCVVCGVWCNSKMVSANRPRKEGFWGDVCVSVCVCVGVCVAERGLGRYMRCMKGRIWSGPRAQLSPTQKGFACATEIQKASVVCPESVRPDMSTIVPEMTTGSLTPYSSKNTSMANSAACRRPPSVYIGACLRMYCCAHPYMQASLPLMYIHVLELVYPRFMLDCMLLEADVERK